MKSLSCRTAKVSGRRVSRATGSALPRGTGKACLSRVSLPSVPRTTMESKEARSLAGPYWGWKERAAFVGARKAPASWRRRCRPSVRRLLCWNFSALSWKTLKGRRRLRLHVFRRHRHRLVRPGVVGLRRLVHVLAPAAPPPGHQARQVLLQRLDRPVHDRRGVAVRGVLLPVHRPSGQRRLEALELVAKVRGDHVVALLLDQVRDDLRGRPRHRFRPLVGQRLGGDLPGEDVLHHQPVLVPPSACSELKSTRSACSRSLGPSAADFPTLLGLGARICLATSPRKAAAARALVRSRRSGNSRRAI